MNNYSIIQDKLRQQTQDNHKYVYSKMSVSYPFTMYESYKDIHSGKTTLATFKLLFFFSFLFVFICYLYGEQDLKKGVILAYTDTKNTILELEKSNAVVKETLGYCRKGYRYIVKTKEEFDK